MPKRQELECLVIRGLDRATFYPNHSHDTLWVNSGVVKQAIAVETKEALFGGSTFLASFLHKPRHAGSIGGPGGRGHKITQLQLQTGRRRAGEIRHVLAIGRVAPRSNGGCLYG